MMTRQSFRRAALLAANLVSAVAIAAACSPSAGDVGKTPFGSTGSGSASGSGGESGSGGDTGGGATGAVGGDGAGSGGGFIDFGDGGGSTPAGDGGCPKIASRAEQFTTTIEVPVEVEVTVYKPFDMLIMYDQSGSMGQNGKWDSIKTALTGFVNDPVNQGVGVGIDYFPSSAPPTCTQGQPDCLCIPFLGCFSNGGGSCNAVDYSTPEVAIDQLPAVAPAIVSSINAHGPGGGTPTTPALAGAQQYAQMWATQHPDRTTIVVLATDGDPTGCTGNTVADVANIAAGGLNFSPPVKTFVIGVGASLTSLNSIAAAGGTGAALIVDPAQDPAKQFLDAMNSIRDSVTVKETRIETQTQTQTTTVDCEWNIPAVPKGSTFDKTKVNVEYSGDNVPTQQVGYVASAADCANVNQGWYFDNEATPTRVLVCQQTCDTVQGITNVSVDVIFGCDRVEAVPR